MKTSTFFSLLLICTTLLFSRCTPDYESMDNTKAILSDGSWKVELFFMGQDQTALYRNHSFSFQGNGSLEVKSSTDTSAGSWELIRDINHREVVRINLSTTDPSLQQLNTLWSITGKEWQRLAMTDRNGGAADFRMIRE